MDAHITKLFDTCAASKEFSKSMLTSSSFMAPITTFVRRTTNTSMYENKYSVAYASKEPMDTVQTCNDRCRAGPTPEVRKVLHKNSSKRRLKRLDIR